MSGVSTLGRRSGSRVGRSSSLTDAVRFCAIAFLALRVLTLVAGIAAGAFPALQAQGVPGWAAPPVHPGIGDVFSVFERFDALWFLRIAETGYRTADGSAAFFPVFPLAIRAVSAAIGDHPYAASLFVSNGAFLVALVVLYRLTEFELGTPIARASIVLLCCFPTAYFFVFPYSESLFLLFAVTSFYGARHRRWWLAGLAAALAASTRSIGFVLVPALAIEAFHQREEGRGSAAPGLMAAAAGTLGTLAYLGWWQLRAGDWLIPIVRQQLWERGSSWPWQSLWDAGRSAILQFGRPGGGYWVYDLAVVLPVIALAVVVAVRMRPSYAIYVWGSLLAPLTFVFADRPLMSMPRFVVTLFPVTWALARGMEPRPALRLAVVLGGALVLSVACVLTVNWFYLF